MKKFLFTVAIATAFAFGMAACNNNAATEETQDTAVQTECCAPEAAAHECTHNCTDSACSAEDCQKCEKKGTEECCNTKAGDKACAGEKHEGCTGEHQHEGCEHACEHATK